MSPRADVTKHVPPREAGVVADVVVVNQGHLENVNYATNLDQDTSTSLIPLFQPKERLRRQSTNLLQEEYSWLIGYSPS